MLDTWYPSPRLGGPDDDLEAPPSWPGSRASTRSAACAGRVVRTVVEDLPAAPADAHDAWLRLHLLSHRLVAPHGENLDGVFGLLTNVVWTDAGPCAVDGFEAHAAAAAEAARPRHRARASTSSPG